MTSDDNSSDTRSADYTQRLARLQGQKIKTLIEPINPYRLNIRRLCKGRTLDVGCGIGRNLRYLGRADSVGVDHNTESVRLTAAEGFEAHVPETFHARYSAGPAAFDTVLFAHVLEHMSVDEAKMLIREYLPSLRADGRIIVICPQERGYASDGTHVTFFDAHGLSTLLEECGMKVIKTRNFPFVRAAGRWFIYNETVVIAKK